MTEQEIIAIIESYLANNLQKTKVSQLPHAATLDGLQVLGVSGSQSVRAAMSLLKGLDGKNPELRKTATHIQWRVTDGTWVDLIALADLKGLKILLEKSGDVVNYKYEGDADWQLLFSLVDLAGDSAYEVAVKGGFVGTEAQWLASLKGEPFKYSDFTQQQLDALKGANGEEVSLQITSTHIQWRLGTGSWSNLIALADLKGGKGDEGATPTIQGGYWYIDGASTGVKAQGTDGLPIELQKTATYLQWRVQGTGTWNNLILLEELKVKGDTGASIELQVTATYIQWRVQGTTTWSNLIALSELKGATGSNIELQKTATHLQWRVQGESTWNNLVTLDELKVKGDTGASVELQVTGTHVQWRVVGSSTWINLIALSELKGAKGDNIELQKTTTHIQWRVTDGTWANLVVLSELKGDTGQGLPAGGSAGQQLVKKSATDYDYEWETPEGAGDMLKSVYDPSGKNGDAFSQDNMKDGTVNKNFTVTDRNNIAGKYEKPGTGIPKTDLAAAVQASLNKADSALQSFTETDPTVPSWAKQTNKPSYTATEVGAIPASQKGANNGVAELDSGGKVPSSQLPSYVDDVLEYANLSAFPTTGESGKIYVAINTNLTYRWTGSAYVEISPSIALGETSATAYRGDRGKIAYDHSQSTHAPSNAQKNSDITKAEIEAKLTGDITSHTHAYASTSHTHNASNINAGTLAIARIPTGTTSSTVALGNHTHSAYVPTSRTVAGKALTGNITLAKGDVGLGNVDNTSDADKPVSTAQAAAIALKIDASKFQVVTELPASPVSGVFYFVKE